MSSEDSQNKKEEFFNPIVIDTQNVASELKSVSASSKIPSKELDFNILEYSTHFRTSKNEEWEELNDNTRDTFENDDFFSYDSLEINQQFKIEIFKISDMKNLPILPRTSLGANKSLTKVVATIHKTTGIEYKEGMEQDIINEINKKKIKNGVLVGVREVAMQKSIENAVEQLRTDGMIQKDITFEVMEGLKPVFPVNDALIMHYKNKIKQEDKYGRVDYAKRGFVVPVEKDEVIIEYIKPKEGKDGRTCRGKYIKVKEPEVFNKEDIVTTEAIQMREDDDSIKYIAMKSGYVFIDGATYDIQEQMDIDGVDFKSTGSIEAGLDSNVIINVKEKDDFQDAIADGMKVETSILNVEGSVGSNAIVKSNDVKIGGRTHKNSKIYSKKAEINLHKGFLEAQEADIDKLEGGTVHADVARIKNAIGGTVIAKKIYIDEMLSNTVFIASELIEIKLSKGHNNKIIIDPNSIPTINEQIKVATEKLEEEKKLYTQMPKKLESMKSILDNSKEAIGAIKERVMELKVKKIQPPSNLLMKLKDYQQLVKDYNDSVVEYKNKHKEIEELNKEILGYQGNIFNAKIIAHSAWSEFNEISFKLFYPPVEITHNTKENEMSREITLVPKDDEKGYEIVRQTEYSDDSGD